MLTDAKKASNAAWDKENMVYQTVKVRKEILEAFRAAVAANGDKVNTVLREAMEEYARGNVPHDADGSKEDLLTEAARQIAKAAAEAEGKPVKEWIEGAVMAQQAADSKARELRQALRK